MDIQKLNEDVEKALKIGFTQMSISSMLLFSQASKEDEYAEVIMKLCNYLVNDMSKLFGMEIIVSFINDMFEDSAKIDDMGFRMYHLISSEQLEMFDEVNAGKEDIFNMLFVYKTKLVAPAFYTEIVDVEDMMDEEEEI